MQLCPAHYPTADLLEEYAEKSIIPGGKNKVLNKYAAFRVLVLDAWLMSELSKADVEFLLVLTERRFDRQHIHDLLHVL
jgi:selenophosphate synthase